MVPAHRNSKSKVGRRRAHLALEKANLAVCAQCSGPVMPHRTCPQCGLYPGKKEKKVVAEKPAPAEAPAGTPEEKKEDE